MLARDDAAMSPDVALAVRFARAALAHDPEADVHREAVVTRWGKEGLYSLTFGVESAQWRLDNAHNLL